MSKVKLRPPPLGQFRPKQSDEEELATFRLVASEIMSDPAKLRALAEKR
jgi:hypothetical protein